MRAIDEFVRVNRIEGNVFMSFDLADMKRCDEIACGALNLECPDFVLPVLFDNSTTVTTMRYSVPDYCVDVESYGDGFDIQEVMKLYDSLLRILEDCGDWYLVPSGFTFEEKHVYIDKDHHTMKLMYIPDAEEKFNEQDIKHLLISLLERCNESSGGNIQLQLYKYFYRPKFSLSEFRKMVDGYLVTLEHKEKQEVEQQPAAEQPAEIGKAAEKQPEVKEEKPAAETIERKRVENAKPEPAAAEPEQQEASPRTYYAPKSNRSQLSQEEIEEMVKSIYSGKPVEEVAPQPVKEEKAAVQEEKVNETPSFYGSSKDSDRNSVNKKKNLFDNVFPGTKSQRPSSPASVSGHHAMLKSISVHARYDLPKQIDVLLNDDVFVIGRATRTGEPTGANYEFSAEITPISRIHAQIEKKEGSYYIQDLGSSNGTFLNGSKLEANKPYMIEDGDKIAFAIAYSKNSIEYAFVE